MVPRCAAFQRMKSCLEFFSGMGSASDGITYQSSVGVVTNGTMQAVWLEGGADNAILLAVRKFLAIGLVRC